MLKNLIGFLLVTISLFLSNIVTVHADEVLSSVSQDVGLSSETLSGELISLGRLESTGTRFELKDSKYLNVSIDSVEQIKLVLESVPEMVTTSLESASGAVSTQITLGGFVPNTTYHKYEDNYHNHMPFTTDSEGHYTYTQDLSTPHRVFIQPRPSTKFIRDDASGGDCISIGTWDASTKTCTLTADLSETIQIDSDGITLDGNNHISTGYGTGNGVYTRGRTGVTIKNLTINKFSTGISLFLSSNNTLSDNNITNSYYGISLSSSRGNTLVGNNTTNNTYGIDLLYAGSSTLKNNIMSGNVYNFSLRAWSYADFDNIIDTSNLVNGKPIYYIKNAVYQTYDATTNAGTFYCINCYNVTIDGLTTTNNLFGVYLWGTYGSTVRNITASNNSIGIAIDRSNGNTITRNNLSNNGVGIQLRYYSDSNAITYNNVQNGTGIAIFSSSGCTISDNDISNGRLGLSLFGYANYNTISGNNISNFSFTGIFLTHFSSFNTIRDNNVLNNAYGMQIWTRANYNTIYNNNFINNSVPAYIWDALGNIFNLAIPTGGNHWSNWTTPDTDSDGFVDKPYLFYGGQDNLPWAKQDGWRPSDSIAPITTIELSGTLSNNNWYISDVQVALTATDFEGSGVAKTEYSFNNIDWGTYTVPFMLGTEGITMIYYRSTDYAGNVETVKTQAIKIDKTPPIIIISAPIAAQYWHSQIVEVTFTANDDISGIYRNAVYLDSQPYDPVKPIDLLYLSPGMHTLIVESENYAGLVATASVTFEVIVDGTSLTSLILRLYEMGAIDNSGIMTSLIQKIEAAQAKIDSNQPEAAINILNAFIQIIDAQSGDHISAFAANLLKADVQYLIGQLRT